MRNGDATSGVVVTVKDNGSGIAPDLRDKVFSPFCTTKARGMGLGLPIVKRTVFDHNGRVDIDSNPQGTRVSVMLAGERRNELRNLREIVSRVKSDAESAIPFL